MMSFMRLIKDPVPQLKLNIPEHISDYALSVIFMVDPVCANRDYLNPIFNDEMENFKEYLKCYDIKGECEILDVTRHYTSWLVYLVFKKGMLLEDFGKIKISVESYKTKNLDIKSMPSTDMCNPEIAYLILKSREVCNG